MKSKQEKLSETQFLKTHCTAEDYKQDSKSSNDNIILYHDKKI